MAHEWKISHILVIQSIIVILIYTIDLLYFQPSICYDQGSGLSHLGDICCMHASSMSRPSGSTIQIAQLWPTFFFYFFWQKREDIIKKTKRTKKENTTRISKETNCRELGLNQSNLEEASYYINSISSQTVVIG